RIKRNRLKFSEALAIVSACTPLFTRSLGELLPRLPKGRRVTSCAFPQSISCEGFLAMAAHAAASAQAESSLCRPTSYRALFYVTGVADPGLLPRLIEPVAKMGHVPTRVHASRESG